MAFNWKRNFISRVDLCNKINPILETLAELPNLEKVELCFNEIPTTDKEFESFCSFFGKLKSVLTLNVEFKRCELSSSHLYQLSSKVAELHSLRRFILTVKEDLIKKEEFESVLSEINKYEHFEVKLEKFNEIEAWNCLKSQTHHEKRNISDENAFNLQNLQKNQI